jgi:hypothetical protein
MMASVVDICNLALAHLGDNATIASIDPPEGSAQAEHCQRFYPMARDTLLEMHSWSFSTKRAYGAEVENSWPMWHYAYAMPVDASDIIAVLPPEARDDYSTTFTPETYPDFYTNYSPSVAAGQYVPQKFAIEIAADGSEIILTNQKQAVLRYHAKITDPTKFSPLFTVTLSWHLASMLAGPVIKGDQGAAEAKRCITMMNLYLGKAMEADSNSRNIKPEHIVSWIAGR